jgi:hypothetical protein
MIDRRGLLKLLPGLAASGPLAAKSTGADTSMSGSDTPCTSQLLNIHGLAFPNIYIEYSRDGRYLGSFPLFMGGIGKNSIDCLRSVGYSVRLVAPYLQDFTSYEAEGLEVDRIWERAEKLGITDTDGTMLPIATGFRDGPITTWKENGTQMWKERGFRL